MQTELTATRRDLADAQQLAQLSETRVIDAQEQLEIVMLDKEVAEERAELAASELEDLKERFAIMEVELDVLKDGSFIFVCQIIPSDFSCRREGCRRCSCQGFPCLHSTREAK